MLLFEHTNPLQSDYIDFDAVRGLSPRIPVCCLYKQTAGANTLCAYNEFHGASLYLRLHKH